MRVYHVQQGSLEWAALRRGIPTASEFDKIITPTGKLSKQGREYAHRLIAERLLDRPLIALDELEWIARGKELEPDAARLYEFERGIDTEPVGFIATDDGRVGASPDRLVGADGILEIKCPSAQKHIGYVIDGFAEKYRPQVQGQLLISEREWCDWISYHPELPPIIERVYRDDVYIRTLADALDRFCEMLETMREKANAVGMRPYIDNQPARGAELRDLLGDKPARSYRVRRAGDTRDDWDAFEAAIWAMIDAGDPPSAILRDNREDLDIHDQISERALEHNRIMRALEKK